MERIEYAITQVNWDAGVQIEELEKYLNSMGVMGWDLVSQDALSTIAVYRVRYIWKRNRSAA